MNLMLKITEANLGIEPSSLRNEQRKHRWLNRTATAPTHNIVHKRYVSYVNGLHPISFVIILYTPPPSNVVWRRAIWEVISCSLRQSSHVLYNVVCLIHYINLEKKKNEDFIFVYKCFPCREFLLTRTELINLAKYSCYSKIYSINCLNWSG